MTTELFAARENSAQQHLQKTRLLVLWTRISPYMCENWRKLATYSDVDVRILAMDTNLARDNTSFDREIVRNLPLEFVDRDSLDLDVVIRTQICNFNPHSILVAGWGVSAYRNALVRLQSHKPFVIMGMDTPWLGRPKQHLARFVLNRFLRRIDVVLAAEGRSVQYAKRLGFPLERIHTRLYSWDESLATRCQEIVKPPERSFLFVGRYVKEKGLDVLVEAYKEYRKDVENPWPLTCCGSGPLGSLLSDEPGISDMGFTQPKDLPKLFATSTVFVLPSRFEPWGVAIAEAMGCGLPVIVTDQCGAGLDLVEHGTSGLMIPSNSVSALKAAMRHLHERPDLLPVLAKAAQNRALQCTSAKWAEKIHGILRHSPSATRSARS